MTGILLCLLAVAAPVPTARPARLPQIGAGSWVMIWNGTPCQIICRDDGILVYQTQWVHWRAVWTWSKTQRLLTICETNDGIHWQTWIFSLDDKLTGQTSLGTTVKFERVK